MFFALFYERVMGVGFKEHERVVGRPIAMKGRISAARWLRVSLFPCRVEAVCLRFVPCVPVIAQGGRRFLQVFSHDVFLVGMRKWDRSSVHDVGSRRTVRTGMGDGVKGNCSVPFFLGLQGVVRGFLERRFSVLAGPVRAANVRCSGQVFVVTSPFKDGCLVQAVLDRDCLLW